MSLAIEFNSSPVNRGFNTVASVVTNRGTMGTSISHRRRCSLFHQGVVALALPPCVVIAAIGGEQVHEVMGVRVVGAPSQAMDVGRVPAQLIQVDLPFLVFQPHQHAQVFFPHALNGLRHGFVDLVGVVPQDDVGEPVAVRVTGLRE